MNNLYDKLGNIFDLQEAIITESINTSSPSIYLDVISLESVEDLELELALATESYLESEADLFGTIMLTNQFIAFENIIEFDNELLEEDIMQESVILEALKPKTGLTNAKAIDKHIKESEETKKEKGIWNKIKTFVKTLIRSIISYFKLAKVSSIKKMMVARNAKHLKSIAGAVLNPPETVYNLKSIENLNLVTLALKAEREKTKNLEEAVRKIEGLGGKTKQTDLDGNEYLPIDRLIEVAAKILSINTSLDVKKWDDATKAYIKSKKDLYENISGVTNVIVPEQSYKDWVDSVEDFCDVVIAMFSVNSIINDRLIKDLNMLEKQLANTTLGAVPGKKGKDQNDVLTKISVINKAMSGHKNLDSALATGLGKLVKSLIADVKLISKDSKFKLDDEAKTGLNADEKKELNDLKKKMKESKAKKEPALIEYKG